MYMRNKDDVHKSFRRTSGRRADCWMYVGIGLMLFFGIKIFVTAPISTLAFGAGFIIYAINRDEV